MRLYPIDDPAHSEVADLLPWYANGTLEDDERARVERHLADCIGCKQELLELRKMQTMYNEDMFDAAASAGLNRADPHYYHTLSAPTPVSNQRAALLVIFESGRSEAQIRELLLALHARIIDGPTIDGVYTLQVAPGERQRALAQLRAQSWIRFAEPVGQDTP
jgi:anti-sigma factor RsiW